LELVGVETLILFAFADSFKMTSEADRAMLATQTPNPRPMILPITPQARPLNQKQSQTLTHDPHTSKTIFFQEYRKSDSAVREGGSLGIFVGANDHNEDHNRVMYSLGCEWR
jgi:hypothetical protein